MRKKGQYAAIGWAVSKFVLPLAKRQAKRKMKGAAKGAVTRPAGAAKRNPGKASIAVGTAVGALGWLVSRKRRNKPGE